ncbi:thioredoxin family protein [Candidatus Uhrbacteria bacterium]|nr:thioredoxin family protein [Candidatus Uhrbacteria bacterium]
MLLEFYGTECPHCQVMMPMVDKLIKEGIEIEKYEVWHDEKNAELMKRYDAGLCGGVPFFFNTKTKKMICGEADEKEVRKWAKDK